MRTPSAWGRQRHRHFVGFWLGERIIDFDQRTDGLQPLGNHRFRDRFSGGGMMSSIDMSFLPLSARVGAVTLGLARRRLHPSAFLCSRTCMGFVRTGGRAGALDATGKPAA